MKPIHLNVSFGRNSLPTALKVAGALILVGALGYLLLIPAPTTKGLVKRTRDKERQIAAKISDAKKKKADDQALFTQRKSGLSADAIGPDALSRITHFAQANSLTLVGFRPQRTVDTLAGLTEYPYQVAVEGPYPAVVKMTRMIEERTTDISVLGLQASSADSESDRVSGTVTIAIFGDPPVKPKPSNPRTTLPGAVGSVGTPAPGSTGTGMGAATAGTAGGATNG